MVENLNGSCNRESDDFVITEEEPEEVTPPIFEEPEPTPVVVSTPTPAPVPTPVPTPTPVVTNTASSVTLGQRISALEAAIGNIQPIQVTEVREVVRDRGGHDITIIPDEGTQTEVGALSSGSITSGFGNINIAGNNITAGTLTINENSLIVDSNGRVGVGTTSPVDTFSVDGPMYLANVTPATTNNRLYANGDDLYWAGSLVGGAAVGTWTTDGTDVWRPTGDVGIGTSTPSAKLEVYGRISQTGLGQSTFLGYQAGQNDDLSDNQNTGVGYQALSSVTTGRMNTALGWQSLTSNTTGNFNTAVGKTALQANTTGISNTGIGIEALMSNTTGINNTALGQAALRLNTTGTQNVAAGYAALGANTTGSNNISIGVNSLWNSTTGNYNVAISRDAMLSNTTGSSNVGIGYQAGYSNTTGNNNIFLGYQAGDSLTTGSKNIVIGYDIDTPSVSSTNTLNIGNLIYGTDLDGSDTTLSSGNVGIATTSPIGRLSVKGDSTDPAFVVSDSSDNIDFIVDSSGRVGIGTDTVGANTALSVQGGDIRIGSSQGGYVFDTLAEDLRVEGGIETEGMLFLHDNTDGRAIFAGDISVGGYTLSSSVFSIDQSTGTFLFGGDQSVNPTLTFEATDSDTGDFGFNTNDAFYFTGSNVGIGTDNPGSLLTLSGGDLRLDSGEYIYLTNSGGSPAIRGVSNQGIELIIDATTGGSRYVNFADSGGTSLMRIDAGGNVGIGDTSPSYKLDVAGTGRFTDLLTLDSGVNVNSETITDFTGAGLYLSGGALTVATSSVDVEDFATSLTAGSVVFSNGSNLTEDNANFFWDDSTNRLGIGTASPVGKLDIKAQSIQDGIVSFRQPDNTGVWTGATAGTWLGFSIYSDPTSFRGGMGVANNGRFTINNHSGNGVQIYNSSGKGIFSGDVRFVTSEYGSIFAPSFTLDNTSGDETGLYRPATNNIGFVTDRLERARFDESGNLGIGDTDPDAILNVKGTTEQLRLDYDDSNYASFTVDSIGNLTIDPTGATTTINGLVYQIDTGNSAYFGDQAGANDDFSNNNNVGIGYQALKANTIGVNNVAVGYQSLLSNIDGDYNVAIGQGALENSTTTNGNIAVGRRALQDNTTGDDNTALGYHSLRTNTTGYDNTAVGDNALGANTTGHKNTAVGNTALDANTTGDSNVAFGDAALTSSQTGQNNTAIGTESLRVTTTSNNTALGHRAGYSNTTGTRIVAIGTNALQNSTTGNDVVGIGYQVLFNNTDGDQNVAIGRQAMYNNTTGDNNVGIGSYALFYNQSATTSVAVGYQAGYGQSGLTASKENVFLGHRSGYQNTTGESNTFLGFQAGFAGTSGNNNILVGYKSGDNLTTGSNNLILGYNTDAQSATADNQLSIGNLIFSEGIDGTGTTVSSGNIGIGTTTPIKKLAVEYSNSSSPDGLVLSNTAASGTWSTTVPFSVIDFNSGDTSGAGAGGRLRLGAVMQDTTGSTSRFGVFGATTADSYNEHLSVTASGFVGIGTTSPSSTFGVVSGGNSNVAAKISGAGAAHTADILQLYKDPGATAGLVFTAGGDLGVGTTSPDAKLHINTGDVIGVKGILIDSDGESNDYPLRIRSGNNASGLTDASTSFVVTGDKNVGINMGSVDPSAHLHVVSSDGDTRSGLLVDGDGESTDVPFRVRSGTDPTSLTDEANTRLIVVGTGNVGIGTSSPSARLHSLSTTEQLRLGYNASNYSSFTVNSSGNLNFAGSGGDFSFNTDDLFVDTSTGYVGIGTTSPLGTLSVTSSGSTVPVVITKANENGVRERLMTATLVGTSANESFFINNGTITDGVFAPVFGGYSSDTTRWPIAFSGFTNSTGDASNSSNFGLIDFSAFRTTNASDPLNGTLSNIQNRKLFTFRNNADVAMTILASGNVGIGTTSPQQKLHVYRSDDGAPIRVEDSNGYCEIDPTTTTWTCTSDERLKKNISSIDSGESLENIMRLNPVTFNWIKDKDNTDRTGLVAQEVEKIYPDLVKTDKDTGLKSVAYGGFVPYILGAIKELGDKIADIEKRLSAAVGAAVETLKVGSRENPAGITLYDKITGRPYCLVIRAGEVQTQKGECKEGETEVEVVEPSSGGSNTPTEEDTATSTPEVVQEETATSTDEVAEVEDTATTTPEVVEEEVSTSTEEVEDVVATTTEEEVSVVEEVIEETPTEEAPTEEIVEEPAPEPVESEE